ERRLDVKHPAPALRQLNRERPDEEEGHAQSERERAHGERPEPRALRFSDPGEDPREKRPRARRRDRTAGEPQDEGPRVTGTADRRELVLERRGKVELERPEHR